MLVHTQYAVLSPCPCRSTCSQARASAHPWTREYDQTRSRATDTGHGFFLHGHGDTGKSGGRSFCHVLDIFQLIVHRCFLRVEMGDCFWVAEDSASVTKRSRYLKHQSVLLHPFFEVCTRVISQYLLGNAIEPRGGGRPIKARCVHAETNSVEGLVGDPY